MKARSGKKQTVRKSGMRKKDIDYFNSLPDEYTPTADEVLYQQECTELAGTFVDEEGNPIEPMTDEEMDAEDEDERTPRVKSSGGKCCIYAIKAVKDLNKAYRNGKQGTFDSEEKPWTTGLKLLKDAISENGFLPVVFADAGSTWDLLYWAKLTKIEIFPNKNIKSKSKWMTIYSFQDMRRYPKGKPPYNKTDLIVDSTGKPMGEGYIKSYVICRRPGYLK